MKSLDTWFCIIGVLLILAFIKAIADGKFTPVPAYTPAAASTATSSSAASTPSSASVLRAALSRDPATIERVESTVAEASERNQFLLQLASNPERIAHGRAQYEMFCLACHGDVQPPATGSPSYLFDQTWHHGGEPAQIEALIRYGFLATGMPGWDGMLPDEDIEAMTAYLLSAN